MGTDVSNPAPATSLPSIPADIVAVSDYETHARARLDEGVWAWLSAGAADGRTAADNLAAYGRLSLCNRVLANLSGGNTRVELFGRTHEHPVLLAPVAYQRLVHPDGELATALAASALKAGMVVSTLATTTLENIATATQSPLWFQLYLQHDRGFTLELLRRAESSGYHAVMLTIDAPVVGLRNAEQRAGFALPPGIEAVNLRNMMPLPPFTARAGETTLFDSPQIANAACWRDVEWLRSQTRLPLLLKGILHPDDARQACDLGIDGIVVSNHGGRVLDDLPASIDALPLIIDRLQGDATVLVDGGIRRGSDVFKALALGADAVLVGRAFMYGLATAGAAGVAHVLHLLRTELESTMALTGCRDIAAIDPSRLWPRG